MFVRRRKGLGIIITFEQRPYVVVGKMTKKIKKEKGSNPAIKTAYPILATNESRTWQTVVKVKSIIDVEKDYKSPRSMRQF